MALNHFPPPVLPCEKCQPGQLLLPRHWVDVPGWLQDRQQGHSMLERGSSLLPQDPEDQDSPAKRPKVKQPASPAVPSLPLQAQNGQHLTCHQSGLLPLSLVSPSAIPTSLEPILALDNLTLHQARSDGVPSPSFLVPIENTQQTQQQYPQDFRSFEKKES